MKTNFVDALFTILENNKEKCGAIECATINERLEELDIISIGGIINKFHTIEEVTYISSWIKIYTLLIQLLERL